MSEMFGGTATPSSNSYLPKTGLAAFKVVAINPSKDEISTLLGREWPFDVDYSVTELNGVRVRPVQIWVHSEEADVTEPLRFYVGTNEKVAQSGSKRFINAKGQFRYAKDASELDPAWGVVRPALEGEFELYSFIQRLIRYKPSSSEASFLKDAQENRITVTDLFNGDFSGMRALKNYFDEHKCSIGLLLAARPKQKQDDEGNVKTYYRQTIISKPDAFFTLFRPEITDYQVNKLKEIYNESVDRGYPLTNDLFTFTLQEFRQEDCVNNAPAENTASAASAGTDWSV